MTADAMPQQRYTAVAIALHWIIAVLIVGMIALGWIMTSMPEGEQSYALFQLHKSIGITILLLSVARVVWRVMNPPPAEPPMPKWQAALATTVHVALYVLIIAMPLSGWLMVSAATRGPATTLFGVAPWPHISGLADLPFDIKKELNEPLEFVHSKLAWVIIVMLGLHLAGAFKHQFVDRDGLLARMAPGIFGRTSGPSDNGHGALWAFGAAALLFAAVAGSSLLAAPPAAGPATTATTTTVPTTATITGPGEPGPAQASPAPSWTVDAAQSSIRFKSAYMGRPFEGSFRKWDADIQFDPAKPQDARIRVAIPTSSFATGQPYFDENATQGDWFDVAKHPNATFEVNEGVFKDSETQYEATGVLTVKGVKYPLRLPFTLNIDGATAKMHGEVTLQRLGLGLGRDTKTKADGDEEWVQNDVAVVIDVVATRQ